MSRKSSCVRKRRFRDEVAARLALADAARKDTWKRRERRAYQCPVCKGWHLTSTPARAATKADR